jgi:hypothetical protein
MVYSIHFRFLALILNSNQQRCNTVKNLEIMKTPKYITAILTVLMIGFASLNGQRAVRDESQANREQSAVKKIYEQKPAKQQMTPQRQVQKPATQQQVQKPATQQQVQKPATQQQVQKPATRQQEQQPVTRGQVSRERQAVEYRPRNMQQPDRTGNHNPTGTRNTSSQNQVAQYERHTSISNNKNPRSDYRAPETRVYRKHNEYADKTYYSGHHYHSFYPTHQIKVYHHYDTYLHHYNVLYYPAYHEIFWTRNMYRDYCSWYPNYRWRYDWGYRIQTISVFEAKFNLGEVAMVYGRVYATWYNQETDDYLLFFGGDYPNQQFTAVLPGRIARRFNWRPDRFFLGEHVTVTGLITTYDGIPEIIVKNRSQVALY